jgi:hypothetical protein
MHDFGYFSTGTPKDFNKIIIIICVKSCPSSMDILGPFDFIWETERL